MAALESQKVKPPSLSNYGIIMQTMVYGAYLSKNGKIITFSTNKSKKEITQHIAKYQNGTVLELKTLDVEDNDIKFGKVFLKYKEDTLKRKFETIQLKENEMHTIYYGKFISKSGKEIVFSSKKKEYIDGLERGEEGVTLIDLRSVNTSNKIFKKILEEYKCSTIKDYKIQKPKIWFEPGEVGIFLDYYGEHTAIILEPGEIKSKMVFVTSSPYWNSKARKISKDEQSLLGYPDRSNVSYFAPVIRHNDFFERSPNNITYPTHRVNDLINEFWGEI